MYDLDVPSASKVFIVDAINKNVWAYVLIVVLVLLSAFFAGTETAYSYCNRHRLKVYADDGNKRANTKHKNYLLHIKICVFCI